MLGLGEIDALERQLRAAIIALSKRGVLNVTLVEAIDEAALWGASFEDLAPFVPGADLDNLLARAPILICAIAAEIGFGYASKLQPAVP
jgi:hypothetical protein